MPCKSAHTYTKNPSCRISLSSCKLRGLCMYHDFKRKTGRFIKQKIIWVSQRMVIFGVDLTRSKVNSQPANLHLSGRVCYCYARTWSWRHHGEVVRHHGRVWLCWNPYVNRYLGAIEAVASIQNICSCQKEVEPVDHFLFLCLTNFTVPGPQKGRYIWKPNHTEMVKARIVEFVSMIDNTIRTPSFRSVRALLLIKFQEKVGN